MSNLTTEEVEHIAKLSNLSLSKDQLNKFADQLSRTLKYVEILNELKTYMIEPAYQTTGLKNVFREDKIKKSLSLEQSLKNAKNTHKGYFRTKAIFD